MNTPWPGRIALVNPRGAPVGRSLNSAAHHSLVHDTGMAHGQPVRKSDLTTAITTRRLIRLDSERTVYQPTDEVA